MVAVREDQERRRFSVFLGFGLGSLRLVHGVCERSSSQDEWITVLYNKVTNRSANSCCSQRRSTVSITEKERVDVVDVDVDVALHVGRGKDFPFRLPQLKELRSTFENGDHRGRVSIACDIRTPRIRKIGGYFEFHPSIHTMAC